MLTLYKNTIQKKIITFLLRLLAAEKVKKTAPLHVYTLSNKRAKNYI